MTKKALKRNKKGFTLVELMVVVAILGALVAIAVPLFANSEANAQKRSCQASLRTMDGAAAQYVAGASGRTLTGLNSVDTLVSGGYLKSAPKCPSDNDPLTIADGVAVCPNSHTY